MQSFSTGRTLAFAILAIGAVALATLQSIAQTRSDHPQKFDIQEAEQGRAVPLPPVVRTKEPDTEQDKTEHQESIEREKAGLDYNRRIAEAAERQAAAADKQAVWALRQVVIGCAQVLVLLGILIAVIARAGFAAKAAKP